MYLLLQANWLITVPKLWFLKLSTFLRKKSNRGRRSSFFLCAALKDLCILVAKPRISLSFVRITSSAKRKAQTFSVHYAWSDIYSDRRKQQTEKQKNPEVWTWNRKFQIQNSSYTFYNEGDQPLENRPREEGNFKSFYVLTWRLDTFSSLSHGSQKTPKQIC